MATQFMHGLVIVQKHPIFRFTGTRQHIFAVGVSNDIWCLYYFLFWDILYWLSGAGEDNWYWDSCGWWMIVPSPHTPATSRQLYSDPHFLLSSVNEHQPQCLMVHRRSSNRWNFMCRQFCISEQLCVHEFEYYWRKSHQGSTFGVSANFPLIFTKSVTLQQQHINITIKYEWTVDGLRTYKTCVII